MTTTHIDQFDLVMFTMSTWHEKKRGAMNRNWSVFEQLQKHPRIGKVLVIDFLPHTARKAARFATREMPYYLRRLKPVSLRERGLFEVRKDLYVYSSTLVGFGGAAERETYRHLSRMLQRLGFSHVLLWSYMPLFYQYFDHIPHEVAVFDAVDNWAEHEWYAKYADRLRTNYQEIADRADVVFGVSSEVGRLFGDHEQVHVIPNGVQPFSKVNTEWTMSADGRIRVGYVGVIQSRVDVEVLTALGRCDDIDVTLWGPVYDEKFKGELESAGCKVPGDLVAHEDIPRVIAEQDVMIIPHVVDAFTKSMHPMKLYDYLAVGKPVVSTKLRDLGELSKYVYIANSPSSFVRLVRKAADQDSVELRKERIAAVAPHSWEARVDDMMRVIDQVTSDHE